MRITQSYRATLIACFLGYVTQAIAINLLPLLFVTFQREFSVSLEELGLLITVSFIVQMTVDLLSAKFDIFLHISSCYTSNGSRPFCVCLTFASSIN